MKNKIFLAGTFLVLFCSVSFANATASYKMDNAAIDAIMADAVEVNVSDAVASMLDISNISSSTSATLSAKNGWVAFALCYFLGGIAIHRYYLGTKGSMWAIYFFTCGGIFGVVPLVDWIVLLIGAIQNDVSKYEGNTDFFMWKN